MSMLVKRANVNDWNDFGFFNPWERFGLEMSKLLNTPFWEGPQYSPLEGEELSTNLFTDGNNLIVRSGIPGVKPEDINVNVKDNILTIEADRKSQESAENKGKKYLRTERSQNHFHSTISLPADVQVDKVTADYKDGVLTVKVPRAEKTQPKQICVACE